MSDDLFSKVYNPDVLSCLANLSNDEVFTSPDIVNQMLDMLPQELFENPDTTFLDPACKTGVFLREIAKRLIKGLENQIPDLQERVDHIFHKQLYGIAITELTSLLSRRGVYCSKYANGEFSITHFEKADGNIRFKNCNHTFKNGKCIYCGASEITFGQLKRSELETHAYEFIHGMNVEEVFKMKFDVIISNPPYQLNSGGGGKGSGTAIPIYNLFVNQAKKLKPRYLTMIIPARWFSGGRGLDEFREQMLNDHKITKIIDYYDSKECFPGVDIAGGVCYFLWEKDNKNNACEIVNHFNGKALTDVRQLDEFDIFIRNNEAVDIVKKVAKRGEKTMNTTVCPVSQFGLNSNTVLSTHGPIKVRNVNGFGFCEKRDIRAGFNLIYKYKVIISAAAHDHAGQPDKDGLRRIISRIEILEPGTICTATYIVVGAYDSKTECENLVSYLKTQFVRFLMMQVCISQHISRETFKFVPAKRMNSRWTDEELNKEYGISAEEEDFINSMIRPFPDSED